MFVSTRDGNSEIYSAASDGSGVRRLTNDAALDDQPAWSPDGARIAFIRNSDVYVMNADGSNVVRRTTSGWCGNPAWSPDGTKIAYSTQSNGSKNIWVVGPDAGSPSLLVEYAGWDDQPDWSSDGSKLALAADWQAYDFVQDVYLMNANGTSPTGLTGDIFDHVDYLHPAWSPRDDKLAVTISQAAGVDQYITHIGVMGTNGSGITPLAPAATWASSAWSPDGTMIAFTSGTANAPDISWVAADKSGSGLIIANGSSPDWH